MAALGLQRHSRKLTRSFGDPTMVQGGWTQQYRGQRTWAAVFHPQHWPLLCLYGLMCKASCRSWPPISSGCFSIFHSCSWPPEFCRCFRELCMGTDTQCQCSAKSCCTLSRTRPRISAVFLRYWLLSKKPYRFTFDVSTWLANISQPLAVQMDMVCGP